MVKRLSEHAEKPKRSSFIGGSDARIIMGAR